MTLGPGLVPVARVGLLPLAVAAVVPGVLELPAALERCWSVALTTHCRCMRMLLIAALTCSISSLVRWLSLMIIMFVRPSRSVRALAMRDTSSRRESCNVSR